MTKTYDGIRKETKLGGWLMKKRKRISLLMAVLMITAMLGADTVNAVAVQVDLQSEQSEGESEAPEEDSDEDDGESEAETETETETEKPSNSGTGSLATISGLEGEYDKTNDAVMLTYNTENSSYVKIYVNNFLKEDDWQGNIYGYGDIEEGRTYIFSVVPYDKNGKAGTPQEKEVYVPFQEANLMEIDVDYNLDTKILSVDWNGEYIARLEIYLDDKMIGEVKDAEKTELYTKKEALEPLSSHVCKVVAFNSENKQGNEIQKACTVDNYEARILEDSLDVTYDETKHQLTIEWEGVHTSYVDVLLNGEELIEFCRGQQYVLNYLLQPGASYEIEVIPYNGDDDAGDSAVETISNGDFFTPLRPAVKQASVPIKKSGKPTGFYKPAVEVKIESQEGAVYDVYRAKKDRKKDYVWIGTVTAGAGETCVYTDETVEMGTYYYKTRRKIKSDTYISQEINTDLSDARKITLKAPKAQVRTQQAETGGILLQLKADSNIVSGYEIYRKTGSGKYKKLAEASGNTYLDKDVAFGSKYSYKVRSYYYDTGTKKKTYGVYSKVSSVRNEVGAFSANVKVLDEETVRVSWSQAANADGYEVYYRTKAKGDAYKLLTVTTDLSVKKSVKSKSQYVFLIKAFREGKNGTTSFSTAETEVRMGFTKPQNIKVAKTTYSYKSGGKVLEQRDRLTWDMVCFADGYCVERYDEATKTYVWLADISDNTTTAYTVSNPVTSTASKVLYRISAYTGGAYLAGDPVEIVPKLGTPAVSIKKYQTGVKLSWQKVKAAERYQVYRFNDRGTVLVGETTKTTFTDLGLDLGVAHTYYVQAVNRTRGWYSNNSESVTYCRQPQKVTGLTVGNRESGAALLRWKKVKKAESYVIYYSKTSGGVYRKLAEVKADTLQYTHNNLEGGATYYYKITAVQTNNRGTKVASEPSFATLTITY